MKGRTAGEPTRIGELAVSEGLISRADLVRCLVEQKHLRREAVSLSLGQVMIRRDLISTTQLVRLLETQKRMRSGGTR